ncbi:MAG: hypothetical protein IPG50_12385 [Myxococcales bacterium]|nr:hypothetical protein [Myxococcales bacterium]
MTEPFDGAVLREVIAPRVVAVVPPSATPDTSDDPLGFEPVPLINDADARGRVPTEVASLLREGHLEQCLPGGVASASLRVLVQPSRLLVKVLRFWSTAHDSLRTDPAAFVACAEARLHVDASSVQRGSATVHYWPLAR